MTKLKFFLLLALSLVFITVSCSEAPVEKFSFSPQFPEPGQTITVSYNPAGTELEGTADIELVAYFYSGEKPSPIEIPMSKQKSIWRAELPTSEKNRLVILKFESGGKVDSNVRRGYIIGFYDEQSSEVAGGKASLAYALNYTTYNSFLDRDAERAFSLIEEEFQKNPQLKREHEYATMYGSLILQLKPEEKERLILQLADELAGQDNLTIAELVLLEFWYRQINQPDRAREFDRLIRNKEPTGDYVQQHRFREFMRLEDFNEKLTFEQQFRNEFPTSRWNRFIATMTTGYYVLEKKYNEALEYLEKHPEGLTWQNYFRVAQEMVKNNVNLEIAGATASIAVKMAESELSAPKGEFETHYTAKELNKRRSNNLGLAQDTFGQVLFKLGKTQDSLEQLQSAVINTEKENTEINEHFSRALAEAGEPDTALEEIGTFLKTEFSTEKMKEHLKQAYVRKEGNEEGFSTYLKDLDEEFSDSLLATLRESILDEPAPDFALKDLAGNRIVFSELRGKVVVIDFWATWCTYCIKSFPGMELAMEKLSDRDDIRFLFIDAWEYEEKEDKEKVVSDFVKEKKLPFQVLLDLDDKVIESFKINSIPTKFIIDKKGNIRFKKVGFEGNTEKMVEELIRMIDMIR